MIDSARDTPLRLLVLAGDGIGPEITSAALRVLEITNDVLDLHVTFVPAEVGFSALKSHGTTLPAIVIEQAMQADGIILGPVAHNDYPPRTQGGVNPSGELRKRLDLFANIRPARTRDNIASPIASSFDLVIVRENTEGFYADRSMHEGTGEYMPTPDLALATRKISAHGSHRIARQAFELARQRRCKVTTVHKANVLRVSDGLFLRCVREVAAEYADVAHEERLIDAMTALLIRDPRPFDVILTTNMFGDILSDEASELAGGLGLGASLNLGDTHAMAQAQHGAAPDIAGKDVANPSSLIGSTAMLLDWLSTRHHDPRLAQAGRVIDRALDAVLAQPGLHTPDLGGNTGTRAFAEAVANKVRDLAE
jgi:3-isopropylmalate dehydrogenase